MCFVLLCLKIESPSNKDINDGFVYYSGLQRACVVALLGAFVLLLVGPRPDLKKMAMYFER